MNRDTLIVKLQEKFPNKFFKPAEEFFSKENEGEALGGIWTSSDKDDGQLHRGKLLFDYYANSKAYKQGVGIHLHNWLAKRGWYCQFHDPGTVMIWEL